MHEKLKTIIFFFIACSIVSPSAARENVKEIPENFRVVNWNMEEGFPHKWTRSLLKDVNGFLWIGTQTGLSRFDGSIFKNYFPGINKMRNVPSGNIQGITEDSLHNIWIGSDNGLWRYDNYADTFALFLPANASANADTYIIPFWSTRDELLCVEADSMITAYNVHTLVKRRVVYLSQKIGDNKAVQFSVYDAGTNSVWMLLDMAGFFHVSLNNGKMDWYHYNGSEGMCYDRKRNAIWMNTAEGLIRFNINSRQFQHIDDANKFFERGVGIGVDQYHRIWVGTAHKGIFIYDPDLQSVKVPFSKYSLLSDSVNWANYRIYCDRDGMVWVGYYTQAGKGITQLIPSKPIVQRYNTNSSQPDSLSFSFHNISSWLKANDSQIWFCGDYMINIFNPNTATVRKIQSTQLSGIDKTKRVVFIGVERTLHKAWVNSGPQFYEVNLATLHCSPILIKDTADKLLSNIYPGDFVVRQFKNGFVFLEGTPGENSHKVFMLQKDSSVCRQLLDFGPEKIINLATDGEKILFIRVDGAPLNKTYFLLQGKWIRNPTPLDSIPWIEIRYNKADETWWAGSLMQIAHYDKNFRLIRRYTRDDGVPDVFVYGIMPDNRGDIWFNGSSGYISKLNMSTGLITTLSEKDGYQTRPYYPISIVLKDDGGDIYFGGYEEIDRISPDKYIFVPSAIYLKSLEIKEFTLPLSTGINNLQDLSLAYFQNRINIETGVIDYYSKGKSHIRYKLERDGKNTDWQYAPANYTIRYEELPPGKYTLVLQGGNAGNEFSGPVKRLFIQISPAFWNTWLFRISAIICIGTLFYGLMRWRLKQKFRLRLERSQQEKQLADIGQKTAELLQQKTELEMQALRAQMNPHFIFNCLNSINRFILANDATKAADYLTKFAKLIRIVLQQSGRPFIPIEDELYCLQLYMDLEALRFEIPFSYEINPRDINISALMVPPLLLQPFVENAIWHGLHPNEKENGRIIIDLRLHDEILHCSIQDNGVGRINSTRLTEDNHIAKKSLGIKLTQHRLELFKSSLKQDDAVIVINDLTNEAGQSTGTCVHIKIPVKSV